MGRGLVLRFGRLPAGFVYGGGVVRVLVVEQDAVGRAVEVVVLSAVDRPEEDIDGDGHDQQRSGNHHVKSWHLDSMPARLRPAAGGFLAGCRGRARSASESGAARSTPRSTN